MKTQTGHNILTYIQKHRQVRPKELLEVFSISNQALHKQLTKLMSNGQITKAGTSPAVFYLPVFPPAVETREVKTFDPQTENIIEENFMYISPAGQKQSGLSGFRQWCSERNFDIAQKSAEYVRIVGQYESLKKNGVIDASEKLKRSFADVFLDKLFYIDFYSVEVFGKTKLGQLILFAKQSQDKSLIREILPAIESPIRTLIQTYKIDAVGFIPPTIKRSVQFMKELEKKLNLPLPPIPLVKVKAAVVVPQKTLSKIADRTENAAKTIMVDQSRRYKNILLLDDAVGSGASLNETARKIRERNIASGQIIGLALVGSLKGFEVISEV